jgi:hypothetical protein
LGWVAGWEAGVLEGASAASFRGPAVPLPAPLPSEELRSLRAQLEEARSSLANAERRARSLRERLAEARGEKWVCPLCMEARVDSVLVPCGHMFCNACLETMCGGGMACCLCAGAAVTRVQRIIDNA